MSRAEKASYRTCHSALIYVFESRQKRMRAFTGCETSSDEFVAPQREILVELSFFSLYFFFISQSIFEELLFKNFPNARHGQ